MSKTNLYNLDLNLLLVLDAIHGEKSLTRAGEKLHLTQSAISHALARLRTHFDDRLFIREGNRMEPTPLCSALHESIDPALKQIVSSIEDRGKFDPGKSTRCFRLGISDYLCTLLLPQILSQVEAEAPGVSIHIAQPTYEQRTPMMQEGKLDIFLGTKRNYSPFIKGEYLFSDREICVVRNDHPQVGKAVREDELASLNFLAFSLSETGQGFLEEYLYRKGLGHRIKLTVQQEVTIPHLVSKSNLVGTMAERLALHFSEFLPIRTAPLPLEDTSFDICQHWHSRSETDAANNWIRGVISKAASSLL